MLSFEPTPKIRIIFGSEAFVRNQDFGMVVYPYTATSTICFSREIGHVINMHALCLKRIHFALNTLEDDLGFVHL